MLIHYLMMLTALLVECLFVRAKKEKRVIGIKYRHDMEENITQYIPNKILNGSTRIIINTPNARILMVLKDKAIGVRTWGDMN